MLLFPQSGKKKKHFERDAFSMIYILFLIYIFFFWNKLFSYNRYSFIFFLFASNFFLTLLYTSFRSVPCAPATCTFFFIPIFIQISNFIQLVLIRFCRHLARNSQRSDTVARNLRETNVHLPGDKAHFPRHTRVERDSDSQAHPTQGECTSRERRPIELPPFAHSR